MKQKLLSFALMLAMVLPFYAIFTTTLPAQANNDGVDVWGTESGNLDDDYVGTETGLGDKDPRLIASSVIKVILGFLGIIAVGLILFGGFKWMTAAGNEDKIDEAKKIITAGVIGLVIILASYGIANFVLSSVMEATT